MVHIQAVDMEHKSITNEIFTIMDTKVGLIAIDSGNYIKFQSEPYTFNELVQRGCFNIEKNRLTDYPIYPINKNDYGWDTRTHYQHLKGR